MNRLVEKRQYDRMPFQKPIEIYPVFPSYLVDSDETVLSGLSQDISGGGLCLKTSKPLRVGSYLKLRFDMSRDQIVESFGKIVWAREAFCGFRFFPTSEMIEGNLQNFLDGSQAE